MSKPSYLLSIDNGTQSMRALLFDPEGQLLAKSKIPLTPYYSQEPGWAEQDPEYYWRALCQACRKLWETCALPKDAILGVALTTQRSTVVNLDKNGQPLRPAIVWLDQRQAEIREPIGGVWDTLFRLLGQSDTVNYFRRQAESNWIRQQQPEIWQATEKYLLLSGYLTYRLTGQYRDSTASQVGYLPFDYKHQRWAAAYDWKWRALGITPQQLPTLIAPGQILGNISAAAAQATGIPQGLPLIAAGADKACEILGAGCLTPDVACLSYGTTATINTTSKKYVEAIPWLPPYPSVLAGAYCTEIQIYRGFWMVSWFKQEFGQPEEARAATDNSEAEPLFDQLVQQVPPGSLGLTLQPYWSPGVRIPGPEAKGAIIGFGDVHTRAHIYRSILEGLAYGLREGKERIEKRSGVAITRLRICGGGSQSDAAMQIAADVFGLPAERPHTFETSGLGAAISAAVGLKCYPDFATAVAKMTRVTETFTPNPVHHQRYNRLYKEVYQNMYRRLQPLYAAIQDITGYPRPGR